MPDDVYIHGHHPSVLQSHSWRTAGNSAAYLLAELTPAMAILDVGCGPGTISTGLAERVPDGSVTAIDSVPEIIEQAAEAHSLSNLTFATGDVYALDFPDATFDVVHAHQVLQHLTDPIAALREMRRVARPGGLVAARDGDYGAMVWYPDLPALSQWRDLYRRIARAAGGEPDSGRMLHAWARRAGLTDVRRSSSTWTYSTEAERQWWGSSWADRATKSFFATQALDGGRATQEDLDRIADGWRAWAAEEDGWFTIINGEILCRALSPGGLRPPSTPL
jgi:ubiquinone/menaquinone biosynthesis C-methylase UbiE